MPLSNDSQPPNEKPKSNVFSRLYKSSKANPQTPPDSSKAQSPKAGTSTPKRSLHTPAPDTPSQSRSPSRMSARRDPIPQSTAKEQKCFRCNATLKSDALFRQHLLDNKCRPADPRVHTCCMCGRAYGEAKKLEAHVQARGHNVE
ncbi:hypothetical protein BJ508DRAFT_327422 [Ascobolus immersus RN42]|uniref:C2H2-type domain-containing protein n=1 Tax=Ascobolus immersus RN42 TaxID=1160509 RepID=A0A3N4I4C4_ASCIM|nr:hypothetical protein BJ508DRAFT_327422 [Ascobolus immersus RN42]